MTALSTGNLEKIYNGKGNELKFPEGAGRGVRGEPGVPPMT